MKLFIYNLIFVFLNFVLLKIANYNPGYNWIDNFFIEIWLVTMTLSVSLLGYVFVSIFKFTKFPYILIIIYLITHIILNSVFAVIDAERLGFIKNILNAYGDKEMFYRTGVPYLISFLTTIFISMYKNQGRGSVSSSS